VGSRLKPKESFPNKIKMFNIHSSIHMETIRTVCILDDVSIV